MKPSTFAGYSAIVGGRIKPALGQQTLQSLHRSEIERFYATLLKQGLATGTIRNIHTVLRKALEEAVQQKLIRGNAADSAFRLRVTRAEMRSWTTDELRLFLSKTTAHPLGPIFRIAAMTGMRRGEVLGLRWDDVDLDSTVLHVRQALTKGLEGPSIVAPKTRRARRAIELDLHTVESLRQWRSQQREEALAFGRESWMANNVKGLVFTRTDGSPHDPDSVSHSFVATCQDLGLPVIRFHDLRHTHATLLLKADTPLHVVSRRLGHSSAAFTADVYSHVLPGQDAEAAEKLALSVN